MPEETITFEPGRVVCGRWKVVTRLGAGGCGSVFKVEDLTRKGYLAALKAEPRSDDDEGVLKLEANLLQKLSHRAHVLRVLASGRRPAYNFIVMTLCGQDLMSLKRRSPEGFSESTILRIGVFALYAIKQVHEIGFIHRDVKPGNMMNGAVGRQQRMFYLIDYGMARSFVNRRGARSDITLRRARKKVLLRGTLRYCSIAVHRRFEQSRADDLWSVLYMLTELYVHLPWRALKDEQEILQKKETSPDTETFAECPKEFIKMAEYLRTLSAKERPDYFKIYEMFMGAIRREEYSFHDLYDWEEKEKEDKEKEKEKEKDKEKSVMSNSKEVKTEREKENKKEDKSLPPPSLQIRDIETAIEFSEREKKTKKSLPLAELELQMYPMIQAKYFKEKVLPI